MGQRGPKKQNPALNELKGNLGKRKLTTANAAFVALEKLPAAPRHLTPTAKQEWRRCGKELIDAGKLTGSNLKGFESYCISYSRLRDADARLLVEGSTLIAPNSGYMQPHPCIAIANKAQELMERWLKMIHNTDAAKPVQHDDPLFDFLNQGKKLQRVK
jgi:P27 family predicted phage terminase small subunit